MKVIIKGQEYEAKLTLKNLKMFKEITGKSLLNEETHKNFDEEFISAFIYSSLGGAISIEQIEEMEVHEATEVSAKIMETLADTQKKK